MNNFFATPSSQTSTTSQKYRRSFVQSFDNHSVTESPTDERFTESSPHQGNGTRDEAESIEVYPSGPHVSAAEPTKLFTMINKRNWAGVVKRCRGDDAKEAKTWIVEKNRNDSVRWKLLPIHQACEQKAPSEVIKALIAAYSDSLLIKDSGGNLPLHLACRERASKSAIGALLSEEPDAAKVKDDEGRLPIHLASRYGNAVQVVDSLIICYYRGARTPDAYGLLPIHWACAQNAPPEIVESLLRANPDSVEVKDKWGRTPLSLAQASTNPDKEAVIDALHKDPGQWSTNMVDEIEILTQKLEQSTKREKGSQTKYQNYVDESERKFKEMQEESEMKLKSVEKENEKLKEEVRVLSSTNKYTDEDLEKFNQENLQLTQEIKMFQSKLRDYAQIFESMESQRVALLKITDAMSNTIHEASKIVGDEKVSTNQKRSENLWKRRLSAKRADSRAPASALE